MYLNKKYNVRWYLKGLLLFLNNWALVYGLVKRWIEPSKQSYKIIHTISKKDISYYYNRPGNFRRDKE